MKSKRTKAIAKDEQQPGIARVCGGITYQPIYTFQEKVKQLADALRSDLLRSSASPVWSPRGFRILIDEKDRIRVEHSDHVRWYTTVSESEVYFQCDGIQLDDCAEILRLQADLYHKICARLGVEALLSLGIKFIRVLKIGAKGSATKTVESLFALTPKGTLLRGQLASLTEAAFRLGYGFGVGGAALQVSTSVSGEDLIVDLDCFTTDVFALGGDYIQFMLDALEHFSVEVNDFLTPLIETSQRDRFTEIAAGG